jgi:GNAT superfamily N-acetyltransferase
MRFFTARHELSDAEVERATHPDNARDVALLVTIGNGTDETVIAGASCLAIGRDNPPRAAEVAFTVEEDYQGRGIASLLLQHLVGIAQKRGLAVAAKEVVPLAWDAAEGWFSAEGGMWPGGIVVAKP